MRRRHVLYREYWAREQPEFIPDLARWVYDGDWRNDPPGKRSVMSELERWAHEQDAARAARA